VRIDFGSSERSSLGVEVELELVDQQTRELRGEASELLPPRGRGHPNLGALIDPGHTPAAGCGEELRHALAIMERGPSYIRQREVVASGGTLIDVADTLVDELRTDRLTPTQKPAIP
jgi:gamma-glutamyl:cysteine ligase YbdK (ATP-grasp superfamily)